MFIPVFTGFDPREAAGWHAFTQSVIDQLSPASPHIAFIPIGSRTTERDGTNSFTYSRFLVPYLCRFEGFAIFVDGSDMLARCDLADLWRLRSSQYAVQVVKHDYKTRHPRKYLGTALEAANADYPRKNWSSVMLWHCAHMRNRVLVPENVLKKFSGSFLHRFEWLQDELIGELPAEWNLLIGEQSAYDDTKLAHYTLGIPGFSHYRDSDFANEWFASIDRALEGLQNVGD